MNRFEKYPVLFSILTLLVFSLPIVVSGFFEGKLINKCLSRDMSQDIGFWLTYFVSIPLFLYLSIRYYTKLPEIFINLFKSNILIDYSERRNNYYIKNIYMVFNNILVLIIIFSATFLLSINAYFSYFRRGAGSWHWQESESFMCVSAIISIPATIFFYYLISQFTLRAILGYYMLINLFKKYDVKIKILHPDNCGGLGELGDFSIFSNIMVFIIGLVISGSIYTNIYMYDSIYSKIFVILMLLFYLIGAFIAVFYPLIAAHKK